MILHQQIRVCLSSKEVAAGPPGAGVACWPGREWAKLRDNRPFTFPREQGGTWNDRAICSVLDLLLGALLKGGGGQPRSSASPPG